MSQNGLVPLLFLFDTALFVANGVPMRFILFKTGGREIILSLTAAPAPRRSVLRGFRC